MWLQSVVVIGEDNVTAYVNLDEAVLIAPAGSDTTWTLNATLTTGDVVQLAGTWTSSAEASNAAQELLANLAGQADPGNYPI